MTEFEIALDTLKKVEHVCRPRTALIANANVGGENVHRGAVLGALLGADAGLSSLDARLVAGLVAKHDIEKELDALLASLDQRRP